MLVLLLDDKEHKLFDFIALDLDKDLYFNARSYPPENSDMVSIIETSGKFSARRYSFSNFEERNLAALSLSRKPQTLEERKKVRMTNLLNLILTFPSRSDKVKFEERASECKKIYAAQLAEHGKQVEAILSTDMIVHRQ